MKGLLQKILIEVRWIALLFGGGLCLIMALLTALLPTVLNDAEQFLNMIPFARPILTALLGVELRDGVTPPMMQAFLWVHPTVLALIWAWEITFCTRVPAGEIDRGSVDFLLGLPISRWQLYAAETVGFLVAGFVVLGLGFCGHLLTAGMLQPQMRPGAFATASVLCNLYAVYAAVGGIAFLISACSDRRLRAAGGIFTMLLISFLLNFLAQFWDPAKSYSFLSVMEYYRPAIVIQNEAFPVRDVAILAAISLVTWTAGGLVFRRRSICTV